MQWWQSGLAVWYRCRTIQPAGYVPVQTFQGCHYIRQGFLPGITSRDFMKFRLGGFEAIKSAYMAQVQYSMWVTRKDAWYFANYDPRMKREGLHYVVVERDEKYMANFDEMVPEFIEKMDEALAEIGFVFGEQWR